MADRVLRPGGEALLRFTVPSGLSADVSIYDVRGRLVRNLARIDHAEGEQTAVWNGDNRDGVPVASGFYFGVLRAGEAGHVSGKILVIR
jgi:flagellar hook assembly protein FlgD